MKKKTHPNEEIYLTPQEVHKFKKALTDPEFQKYWDEYLKELTDPAGRKEREEFMLEQAKKNDLPPNTELVRPDALFCFKTYTRRLLTNQGAKKYIDQKLFVNVCTSGFIDPPDKMEVMNNGVKMYNWSVPYTLSKPRATRDNKEEVCMAIDIIFNSKCAGLSRFEEFKKMMCDTAIEGINTFFKEYHEKASQNYKLLKKLQYKGGVPEFILAKKRPDAGKSALSENLKTENHLPQSVKEIYDGQAKSKKKPETKEEDVPEEVDVDVTAKEAIQNQKKSKHQKRIKAHNETPVYSIVESHSNVELTECFDGPEIPKSRQQQQQQNKQLPNALTVKIGLPGVRNMKNAKLELKERRLKFEYLQNYILDVSLPYFVIEGSAKAKYDKEKEVLTVEVEVNKAKYTSATPPAKEGVVDLTMLGKKGPETKEEIETEKVEIPNLFNIYKPDTEKKAAPEDKKNQVEIKTRADLEPESEPLPAKVEETAAGEAKGLITEVPVAAESKAKTGPEPAPDIEHAQRVEGKYDFKQLGDVVILLYRVKGYKKETVTSKLTNNEMLLEVYDPTLKAVQRTCVTLFLPIVARESTVETFIDFISVKLKKADPNKMWDSLGYSITQLSTPPPVLESKVVESKVAVNAGSHADSQKKPEEESQQKPQQDKDQDYQDEEKEKERQDVMEKAEDALEQKERRGPAQFVHLRCPIIYSIY
ncbi:MAG: hypothetical protein P4L67_02915 [Candidatus Pacebacteria bacterium]|nr:hypothetical protein [Candidatus Paceibacterota bacterium]